LVFFRNKPFNQAWFYTVLFIAALILSLYVRFSVIAANNGEPLRGDAGGFALQAAAMKNFYAASAREPFWILWVKCAAAPFKEAKTGMRLAAAMAFSLSAVMLFLILSRELGNIPALAGGLFYLVIPYMYFSHIRAHRLELYLLLLLLFAYLMLRGMNSVYSVVAAAMTASALILTRMESLAVVIGGFAFYVFSERRNPLPALRKSGAALFAVLLLAAPFFISCRRACGAFFLVLNNHARFWDSHEHAGEGGFRSPEETLAKPYDGRNVSVFQYVFSGRNPGRIVVRFVKGYYKTFTRAARHMLRFFYDLSFLIYPFWAGLLMMPFSKKGRELLFWGLLFIFPHAYILNLNVVGKPSVDIRFAASSVPLMAFAAGFFIFALTRMASILFNNKSRNVSPAVAGSTPGIDNGEGN